MSKSVILTTTNNSGLAAGRHPFREAMVATTATAKRSAKKAVTKPVGAAKSAAKKTTRTAKSTAKKSPTKKATGARKTTAKKSPARKATATTSAAKKTATRKATVLGILHPRGLAHHAQRKTAITIRALARRPQAGC